MSVRSKKLVLKRCYLPQGYNGCLEDIVEEINKQLPNHVDRRFGCEDLFKEGLVAEIEKSEFGHFVEIQTYDKGATGLINFGNQNAKTDIEEFHAPDNKEFLDSHIILLIAKNHIIACGLGNRDASLKHLFSDLGKKSGCIENSLDLRVDDVPNQSELQRVSEVGVKCVNLNLSSYLASFEEFQNTSTTRNIAQAMQKILGSPDDTHSLRKRANVTGRLVLRRGRFVKEELEKDEWLTDIAETIIDSRFDDYTIELEDGTKVSTAKLKVNKPVKLKRFANTVDTKEAKAALETYYKELQRNGALEW